MKKAYLLAVFTSILLACNTNLKNNSKDFSASNHATHNHNNTNNTNQNPMNPISATMDSMMHKMHSAKPSSNNEIDFATMMLEHHKGAVEMSKVEIDKGSSKELKAFAQKVIDDQNKEIGFMQDFILNAGKTTSSNTGEFQKALHHSMMAMMDDKTTIYNHIDKDYAALMIPHHQSAVDMAKAYLEFGKEKSLTTLCQNIISSQEKEIKWLKEWLVKNTK